MHQERAWGGRGLGHQRQVGITANTGKSSRASGRRCSSGCYQSRRCLLLSGTPGFVATIDMPRLDAFAKQGMKLLNFARETQCTPSRSALMTGRYSIRSGNHTVALVGDDGGLVTWEKTMGSLFLKVRHLHSSQALRSRDCPQGNKRCWACRMRRAQWHRKTPTLSRTEQISF